MFEVQGKRLNVVVNAWQDVGKESVHDHPSWRTLEIDGEING
jgi:hypothetical protein